MELNIVVKLLNWLSEIWLLCARSIPIIISVSSVGATAPVTSNECEGLSFIVVADRYKIKRNKT